VFNISVDRENEFFANGVLTHNCDALAYIGLGLRRQYGPERNAKPKVEPIAGTLAYLQKNDKWMKEKRVAAHARLF
jgi:hypothetical protein